VYNATKRLYIDSKELLNIISQEQVFLNYLGIYPDLNKKYVSPFRKDSSPGCRFVWHSGLLYFVDNATYKGKLYWSIFDVVREVKQLSYQDALQEIYNTSDKSLPIKDTRTLKLNTQIRFTHKPFNQDNLFMLDNAQLNKELIFLNKEGKLDKGFSFTKGSSIILLCVGILLGALMMLRLFRMF